MVGVTFVLFLDAVTASEVEQIFKDIIENINLQSSLETVSNFRLEDDIYYNQSTQNLTKFFTVMKNSDYPESCFVFSENKNAIFADIHFLNLVEKFASYSHLNPSKSVCSGKKFRLSDFYITISKFSIGQSTANSKGVFVEFEYIPCNNPNQCTNLLLEFINGMFPEYWATREEILMKIVQAIPNFNTCNRYLPIHTMQQYLEYIKLFRKIN